MCRAAAREQGYAVFKLLWNSKIPSKEDTNIPTKLNLINRGLALSAANQSCVFCNSVLESEEHLFLSCNLSISL